MSHKKKNNNSNNKAIKITAITVGFESFKNTAAILTGSLATSIREIR